MATTTPNYGWDVPTSTDYVKDGATAIETLGDDIDASLFSITKGKNVGLTFINTTTFSGSSAVSLPTNTFTSDFENYRIILNLSAGSNNFLSARMRAAGVDNTSANYSSGQFYILTINSTTGNDFGGTPASSFTRFGFANADVIHPYDIFAPKLARKTSFSGVATSPTTSLVASGSLNDTTSYDSMSFIPLTGTISGKVEVYGYRAS